MQSARCRSLVAFCSLVQGPSRRSVSSCLGVPRKQKLDGCGGLSSMVRCSQYLRFGIVLEYGEEGIKVRP